MFIRAILIALITLVLAQQKQYPCALVQRSVTLSGIGLSLECSVVATILMKSRRRIASLKA
jgi:hypothetical protein